MWPPGFAGRTESAKKEREAGHLPLCLRIIRLRGGNDRAHLRGVAALGSRSADGGDHVVVGGTGTHVGVCVRSASHLTAGEFGVRAAGCGASVDVVSAYAGGGTGAPCQGHGVGGGSGRGAGSANSDGQRGVGGAAEQRQAAAYGGSGGGGELHGERCALTRWYGERQRDSADGEAGDRAYLRDGYAGGTGH